MPGTDDERWDVEAVSAERQHTLADIYTFCGG